MHNNYYFLRKLSASLETKLKGTVISECFTQNKEELVIRFETHKSPFFIKAALEPRISALSFPKEFHRARKNSVDLFETIIGRRVQSIRQFENERSFALLLSDDIVVLFKMHGTQSNIIVFEKSQTPILFRKTLVADANIQLNQLDRSIDWSFEAFKNSEGKLAQLYFTFGKLIWSYLETAGLDHKNAEGKWNSIIQLTTTLEKAETFYIVEHNSKIELSLVPIGVVKATFKDAIEAANEFYYRITHGAVVTEKKQKIINELSSRLQTTRNYIKKTAAKLQEVENNNNYKIWADLIMANMHTIPAGAEKVKVENFYNQNKPLEIKLRQDQSPQRNAETFYRKAKNQQIEINKLRDAISKKEADALKLESDLALIQKSGPDFEVEKFLKINPVRERSNETALLPYHEFIVMGYKIWVGRNAESNDILTLKFSYKEDLWLHAKDVAGSHVLIKHQAGKNFPKDVIERAAELAAYNSKRKNDSLCPVIVTPKKFVRKRKGDPAGAVVVEREEVIMVVPKLQ